MKIFLVLLLLLFLGSACTELSQDYQQAYTNGKLRYINYCAHCHGKNGEGFKKLYPPLRKWMHSKYSLSQVACIVAKGLHTPLRFDSITYKVPMPPMEELTPSDIAFLLTFLNAEYYSKDELVTQQEVKRWLKSCPENK